MSNTSSFFGRHGSVLIASVFSPLQTVWDLSHCANHHASHVWVFVRIFMCANKRRKGRRNREVCFWFIYGGERAWCDLMSGSSMGHWTLKIKRQRWPWLEVSLTDYFMSVFKCAHTCACWWLVCSWTGVYKQSESHAVYHLQCQVRACWLKPGEAASHPQTERGYMCVWGPGPGWCIRDGEEWSQTCAKGQGQRSLYTNTPREIKCEKASGPVGPLD